MRQTLPVFEVEVAKKTADRIRKLSGEVSRLSWALDEAVRNLRQTDPEDILLYSELIAKVLIAQQEADIFLTRVKTTELAEAIEEELAKVLA